MAKNIKKKNERRLGRGLGGLLHKPVEVLKPVSKTSTSSISGSGVTDVVALETGGGLV